MSHDPDRNYRIAVAVARREPLEKIAAAHGLTPARIRIVAQEHAWMIAARGSRPVPPGLTIRAAIAVERAIGIWPAEKDAPEIARRRMDILKSAAGRRVIMEDLERWQRSLDDERHI